MSAVIGCYFVSDQKSVMRGVLVSRMRVVRAALEGQVVTRDVLAAVKESVTRYLEEVQTAECLDLGLDKFEVVVVESRGVVTLDVFDKAQAAALRGMSGRFGRTVL